MVHRDLFDKTYLSLGLLSPLSVLIPIDIIYAATHENMSKGDVGAI